MAVYVTEEKWIQVNPENKALLKEFLIQIRQEGLSPSTFRTYSTSLRLFFVYMLEELENQSILNLGKKAYRNYSLFLQERGVSNATHNNYMSAIRSMLERFEDDDDISYDVNMARRIKGLKKDPVHDITFLTDLQVERLYHELMKKPRYYQHALFLSLAYDSTARRAELMQVHKNSFYDPDANKTNEVYKKGGKKEAIIYFSRTKEVAKLYLEHRGQDDNPLLWMDYHKGQRRKLTSANSWCETMSRILSGIESRRMWFTPHDLRHSAIENYTEGEHYMCPVKRVPYAVEDIQKLASHASSAMTQSYKQNVGQKGLESVFGIKL